MREQVIHMLTEAAEVEHNLLCCYLYAAFSLKREDEGLREREARAVKRWRSEIMGVAIQEMAHLATVNNLLVAVGADPHFDRPNFPVPPGYHPASFDLRLAPFCESTLDHFIFLERPEASGVGDADAYVHASAGRADDARRWITPSAREYKTIGEFYATILDGVRELAALSGADAFVQDNRQVSGADLGLPGVILIHDLATAIAALKAVVVQGEGAPRTSAESHFERFSRIKEEWAELRGDNRDFVPAHGAAADPVMRKPVSPKRTWITNSEAVPLLDLANAIYGALLTVLSRMYARSAAPERKSLAGAAVKLMHALSPLAEKLTRIPAREHSAGNAGMTFTVPRNIGARGDLRVVRERLTQLAAEYGRVFPANPLQQAAAMLSPASVC